MIRTWGAVALVVAALAAGCSSAPVAKQHFLDRANAVCRSSGLRLARLARPAGAGAQRRSTMQAGFVDAYTAEMRDELSRLRKLGYPAGERRMLQGLYNGLATVLAADERAPAAFDTRPLAALNERLRSYGLTACRT